MSAPRETRWDVSSPEQLRELVELPLPLGLGCPSAKHSFLRDIYLDTPDGRLHQRGLSCRFRVLGDDRRLTVFLPAAGAAHDLAESRHEEDLGETDPLRAAAGTSAPARFLLGLVEPDLLEIAFAVHTERFIRASGRRLLRSSKFQFAYDIAAVEKNGIVRSFQELSIRRLRGGTPRLAQISAALHDDHGLRPLLAGRMEREWSVAAALAREEDRRSVGTGHAVALVALDRDTIACRSHDGALQLPVADGSGEGACRHLLMECFGTRVGELHLIGNVARDNVGKRLEVWLARHVRHGRSPAATAGVMLWLSLEDLIARVGTGTLRDRETLAALLMAARSDLFSRDQAPPRGEAKPHPVASATDLPASDDGDVGTSVINGR